MDTPKTKIRLDPISRSGYVSFWRRTKLRSFVYAVAVFPIYLLAKIAPKASFTLYGSYNGRKIGDNSWADFSKPDQGKNSFFITKNKFELTRFAENRRVVYCYSLRGIWLQLRASEVSYSHTIDDFFAPLIMGAKIIALGHGVPMKKSAAADLKLSWSRKPIVKYIILTFVPYLYHYYCDEVVSPSPIFDSYKLEVYGYSQPKIVRKQMPRLENLETKNKVSGRILYAPTFRKKQTFYETILRAGLYEENLARDLKAQGLELWLKPHYLDAKEAVTLDLPNWVKLSGVDDVTDIIGKYEVLITDYSSIFYDSLMAGTPVVFLTADLEQYREENSELFDWYLEIINRNGAQDLETALRMVATGQSLRELNLD